MTRDAVVSAADDYAAGPDSLFREHRKDFLAALTAHETAIRAQALEDAAMRVRNSYQDHTIDSLVDAIRALAQTPPASAWLPIESAPRDGTSILVWPPTYRGVVSCAHWDDDKYARKPRPFWKRTDDFGRVTGSRDKPPTHWMPIPAPPQTKEDSHE